MGLSLRLKVSFGCTVFFILLIYSIIFKAAMDDKDLSILVVPTLILFAFFYMIFLFVPSMIAMKKNRSAWGFFILSLFITPFISLAIALIVSPAKTISAYEDY